MPSPSLTAKVATSSTKQLKKVRRDIDGIRDQIKTYVVHVESLDASAISRGFTDDVLKPAVRVHEEVAAITKQLDQVTTSKKRKGGPPGVATTSVRDQLKGAMAEMERTQKDLLLLDKDIKTLAKVQLEVNRRVPKGGGAVPDPALKALLVACNAMIVLITGAIKAIKSAK